MCDMPEMELDLRALRRALGSYATGVTIVTAHTAQGAHTGVTVNSFTSVSLEPPLVLFCLSVRSSLLTAFVESDHFAVNVLAASHQAVSQRFARPSVNTWDGVQFRIGTCGCALLSDALATFECARHGVYPGGDHVILVGRVLCFEVAAASEPLAFWRGTYGTFVGDQSAEAPGDGAPSEFVSYWG